MNWFKKFWKALSEPVPPYEAPVGPTKATTGTCDESYSGTLTPRAQQVLALARKEANRFHQNFVGTEHVLLGIIALGQGVAVNVLQKLGVDLESLRTQIEQQLGTGPDQQLICYIPYTPRVKRVLAQANKERRELNHTYLGTEHILLGLLSDGEGLAGRILLNLELDIERTRQEILKELDPNFAPEFSTAQPTAVKQSEPYLPPAGPVHTAAPSRQEIQGIDLSKRYDVYCVERYEEVVVYRNALFKGVKKLFRGDNDRLVDFIELEQSDGQTVCVVKYSIIKSCEPGSTPNAENIPGKQP